MPTNLLQGRTTCASLIARQGLRKWSEGCVTLPVATQTNAVSFPLDAGTEPNRTIAALLSYSGAAARTVTSFTYDNSNLTLQQALSNGSPTGDDVGVYLYRLQGASAGTNTLRVAMSADFSDSVGASLCGISFVNAGSMFSKGIGEAGPTITDPVSTNVTTDTNRVSFSSYVTPNTASRTTASGLLSNEFTNHSAYVSFQDRTNGDVTFGWDQTAGNNDYQLLAAEVLPASFVQTVSLQGRTTCLSLRLTQALEVVSLQGRTVCLSLKLSSLATTTVSLQGRTLASPVLRASSTDVGATVALQGRTVCLSLRLSQVTSVPLALQGRTTCVSLKLTGADPATTVSLQGRTTCLSLKLTGAPQTVELQGRTTCLSLKLSGSSVPEGAVLLQGRTIATCMVGEGEAPSEPLPSTIELNARTTSVSITRSFVAGLMVSCRTVTSSITRTTCSITLSPEGRTTCASAPRVTFGATVSLTGRVIAGNFGGRVGISRPRVKGELRGFVAIPASRIKGGMYAPGRARGRIDVPSVPVGAI